MEGHAIHGSFETRRLGTAASHGCVRLSPDNAATLFALVQTEGLSNSRVVISGTAPAVASRPARNARPRELAPPPGAAYGWGHPYGQRGPYAAQPRTYYVEPGPYYRQPQPAYDRRYQRPAPFPYLD